MVIRYAVPAVAVMALVACGEEQTAEAPATPTTERPATATAPTPPATPPASDTAATTVTTPTPAAPAETTGATGQTNTQVAVAPPPATTPATNPLERYQGRDLTAGSISLRLNPDQRFVMQGSAGQGTIEGQYTFENGVLTFSNPQGDIGDATFPMRCRLQESGEGFTLDSVDGSCTRFEDMVFKPAA